ncbi:aryl-alcohol dehydrogenase-like predicted oxidoreductase [Catenuloplanes nepalensis]|uniref:Aryl-alcohol dehydrogenase-like predicted oxidoreductase n=1 Tax=Catenuloplanes nepalensis TaxID=587533 RepID=A0ABT9MPX3_9ACTN|nr:aldo/keto reductase [Catenuloplanes nepalensis]MDP9793457.1 aryl-alcohol dehydrogenase-like predicted oxidoreductase [Catenuloplanes nepalensis]
MFRHRAHGRGHLNILVIPGTSSVAHLRENLAAADLELPPEAIARLDA